MNKQDFLAELRTGLSGLPKDDIEERVSFYEEMIEDRMEEGLSEEKAVSEIGDIDAIVSQIIADTPLTKLVKERVRPSRTLRAWEIVLLVLGSPIWLSLLLAAVAVVLAVYIVIWAVVITLWSVEAAFAACSLGGIVAAIIFAFQGHVFTGIAMLGAGICSAGFAIMFAFVCKAATKGMLLLTKKIALGIKSLFVGKEAVK